MPKFTLAPEKSDHFESLRRPPKANKHKMPRGKMQQEILAYIRDNSPVTRGEIANRFSILYQAVIHHVRTLCSKGCVSEKESPSDGNKGPAPFKIYYMNKRDGVSGTSPVDETSQPNLQSLAISAPQPVSEIDEELIRELVSRVDHSMLRILSWGTSNRQLTSEMLEQIDPELLLPHIDKLLVKFLQTDERRSIFYDEIVRYWALLDHCPTIPGLINQAQNHDSIELAESDTASHIRTCRLCTAIYSLLQQ